MFYGLLLFLIVGGFKVAICFIDFMFKFSFSLCYFNVLNCFEPEALDAFSEAYRVLFDLILREFEF